MSCCFQVFYIQEVRWGKSSTTPYYCVQGLGTVKVSVCKAWYPDGCNPPVGSENGWSSMGQRWFKALKEAGGLLPLHFLLCIREVWEKFPFWKSKLHPCLLHFIMLSKIAQRLLWSWFLMHTSCPFPWKNVLPHLSWSFMSHAKIWQELYSDNSLGSNNYIPSWAICYSKTYWFLDLTWCFVNLNGWLPYYFCFWYCAFYCFIFWQIFDDFSSVTIKL